MPTVRTLRILVLLPNVWYNLPDNRRESFCKELCFIKENEVNTMSLEAIQTITELEQENRARKADAAAEAKRIVSEAERAGKQAVEQARAEAEGKVKTMMADAEHRAALRARQIMADNDDACLRLKQDARTRLSQAADLIAGRVGDN